MKKFLSLVISFFIIITTFTACVPEKQTQNSDTSKKDDFYTAINEEWINSVKIQSDNDYLNDEKLAIENIENFYIDYFNGLSSRNDLSEEESKLLILYDLFLTNQSGQNIEKAKEYADKIEKAETLKDIENLYSDERLSLYNGLLDFEIANTRDSYVLSLNAISITGNNITKTPYTYNDESKKTYTETLKNLIMNFNIYDENKVSDMVKRAVDLEVKISRCFAENYTSKDKTLYNSNSNFLFNTDIEKILKSLGYDSDYTKIMCCDAYVDLLNNELFTEENTENLKAYFTVAMLCRTMGSSQDLSEYSKVNFYNIAQYHMKDVLVKGYLKENIKDEDIENITEMANKIIDVYKSKIDKITYLSGDTKEKAKLKLDNLSVIVARPQTLINYSKADISDKNSYIENCENSLIAKRNEQNRILKEEYSKDKIVFDTMEINAYNNFGNNSIIINAGILQKPVYDRNKPFEENLGGIGTIVAHEVSHTLDITGSEYDENGYYKNWWSGNDKKLYVEKVTQLKNFMYEQGKKDNLELNTSQTKGEDIADLTGIQCCVEILNGIENADYEKFFTDYAVLNREKYSDEVLEMLIKYDTHSPSKYRVNVPLQQTDEFYSTFGIKEGDGMYVPENERISIW